MCNQYTCFVMIKNLKEHKCKTSDIIKYVEFTPHETFNNTAPVRVVPGEPLSFKEKDYRLKSSRRDELTWSYIVWGYFNVPIKITFNPVLKTKPVEIDYMLDFSRPLTAETHTFCFDAARVFEAVKKRPPLVQAKAGPLNKARGKSMPAWKK